MTRFIPSEEIDSQRVRQWHFGSVRNGSSQGFAVMPEMTGFELCRTVREQYPRIRIIGMTGHVNVNDFEKSGAHACFYKPVPFQELHKAIQRLCQADAPVAL